MQKRKQARGEKKLNQKEKAKYQNVSCRMTNVTNYNALLYEIYIQSKWKFTERRRHKLAVKKKSAATKIYARRPKKSRYDEDVGFSSTCVGIVPNLLSNYRANPKIRKWWLKKPCHLQATQNILQSATLMSLRNTEWGENNM